MKLQKFINPLAQENTYLLTNAQAALVIDPGNAPEQFLSVLTEMNLPLSAVLLTHAHFDHIWGLDAVRAAFPKVSIYLHQAEQDWPTRPDLNASRLLLGQDVVAPEADHFYQIDSVYELDDFRFSVRETPGHSIGGVSLVFPDENLVFSGDALFRETIGRWDLPTGNQAQLLHSVRTQLFSLPQGTRVLPGHGPETTIGHEKNFNPFF